MLGLMVVAHTLSGSHLSMASSKAAAGMWAVLVSLAAVVQASTWQNLQALTGMVLLVVAEVEAGQLAGAPSASPPDAG